MNSEWVEEVWKKRVAPLSPLAGAEWKLVEAYYNEPYRHYHNLQHLAEMFTLLQEYYQGDIPLTTVVAVFYHDIIYSTLRSDNEKQSAEIARNKLEEWGQNEEIIRKVEVMILATAAHQVAVSDEEANVFLDADMAILGSSAVRYEQYRQAVRKEFDIYPDFIYNRGRRQFLQKAIQSAIYKSDFFSERFTAQALANIQNEINSLL